MGKGFLNIDSSELKGLTVNFTNNTSKFVDNCIDQLSKSPNLETILGKASQRTIDAQVFPKFTSQKYIKYRFKKFGSKPYEKLTGELYKRLGAGKGQFNITLSGNTGGRIIKISFSDKVARGQELLGRHLLREDEQLNNSLADEFNDILGKNLKDFFKT